MLKNWISLFQSAGILLEGAPADSTIDLIVSDSRQVLDPKNQNKKLAFFARKGVTSDGHDFLPALATSKNISAFIVERTPARLETKIPLIVVRDATLAMAMAVKNFYDDPSAKLFCAAVTGTNGKTTTTFLVQALLKQLGYRCARTGTIETEFEGARVTSALTTPDFSEMQKLFSELRAKGANAIAFEASSHALDQRRLLGIEVDASIFTNLTPEHLDYHRTMENYYQAKRKLFFDLIGASKKNKKFAIIRDDGSYGSRLISELRGVAGIHTIAWGFDGEASAHRLVLTHFQTDLSGSELRVRMNGSEQDFRAALVGNYNIENMMGMIALGFALGASGEKIQSAFDELPPVSGRLERVPSSKASIFVDYAHTPDALENVLSTLRPLTKGKLKVVFGCGGDRDRLKRPQMGAIAELYADELFVTSDNPRTEDPDAIIQEILQGIQRLKPVHVEADRRKAIALSLRDLHSDDVVLIAGKGHETYQILGTTKIDFDDRKIASESLARLH